MTDTTDLLQDASADGESTAAGGTELPAQGAPAARPRRRATATGSGLAAMVLPELQALAGTLGIGGTARMRKSQLIEAIQAEQGVASGAPAGAPAAADAPQASGPAAADAPQASGPAAADAPQASGPAARAASSPRTEPAADPSANGSYAPASGAAGTATTSAADQTAGPSTGPAEPPAAEPRRRTRRASAPVGTPAVAERRDEGAPEAALPAAGAGPASGTATAAAPVTGAASGRGASGAEGTDEEGSGAQERPERIDRGRERFLEREARRQERLAQQAAESSGDRSTTAQARQSEPRAVRTERDVPARADRDVSARPERDTTARADRDAPGRTDRDLQRGDAQDAEARDGARRDDDDETGTRRGRFRERGRNRRGRGTERYSGDAEPMVSDDDVLVPIGGILDILDNYGFVRTSGYLTGPNDVYVSLQQVRKYGLRRGDALTGAVRQQREGERREKYNALVRLDTVNGMDPEEARTRPEFTKLTPLYPQERLRLETDSTILTTRVIDLVMPVGKGQRALIVSPPKAGKTMVMQAIANAISVNNPEVHLMVVLVDERPEEVTDMQRSVKGEVIASTFDRPPQDHITVAELSIERAKRLVELGHDVVVLLDSITRLGRAYNLGAPASGRILTGGVDSAALYPPKRFLGAARNVEHGGSLTIFATALVETGSAMDTVIFEEFKGTGNAELKLDRRLADKRIFPAIDVDASGTRKEEILLAPEELRIVLQLRRVLHALDTTASLELLLDKMKATRTNVEFLMQIQKTTVSE